MFRGGFFEFVDGILNLFYEIVPNFAIAIALLTIAIMIVTTPLTLKGTRSMIEMQRLQPELKRIQAEYKHDRQKLNEEMMRFYRENNVNPVGGCLPLLIQAPVLAALFWVVRGLIERADFVGLQELAGGNTTPGFRPRYSDPTSDIYQALVGKDEMVSFGVDLARTTPEALQDGFLTALPYIALVGVIGVLSWYQQKQISARTTGEMTQQQRMMMRIGPVTFVFFAFIMPAALGVYFLTSTLYRVGLQAYITHRLYGDEESLGRQAQQAIARAREMDGKRGGGGLLGGLTGGGATAGKDDGGRGAERDTKAAPRASRDGGTTRRGRAGAASGPPSATGGTGARAKKPHPRSRRKKKRK
jgi:YidC/Oxa1 family membrane protein insertase